MERLCYLEVNLSALGSKEIEHDSPVWPVMLFYFLFWRWRTSLKRGITQLCVKRGGVIMSKTVKNEKRISITLLIVALCLCLLSMIGTAFVQSGFGQIEVTHFNGTLAELSSMIEKNNATNGKNVQIHFQPDAQYQFHFMMLKPKSISSETPVPAIICAHGGANTLELQMTSYLELARRGFYVISIDMAGHGWSDNGIQAATANSYGMLAAVEYAMSLDYVDETQVGVTGHSLGNEACFQTIATLNTEGSTQRVAAWVEGSDTMRSFNMTPEYRQGLLWTLVIGKYDEFDTTFFGAHTILSSDTAKGLVSSLYPQFKDDAVTDGQWYSADGPVSRPENGSSLGIDEGVCIQNPQITHPMFHFSKTGSSLTVQGFYDAFGVPVGANYIDPNTQIWPFAAVFQGIGLIGFFALLFPLVNLLANSAVFRKIKRPIPDRATLPSIKDPREWVVLLVSLIAFIIVSFFAYRKLFPMGMTAFNDSVYPGTYVVNGTGLWTMACGLFAIAVLCVQAFIRKILYRKDHELTCNTFSSGIIDSISQFLLTVLFSFVIVALMYIPVYFAHFVFGTDFRVCSFAIISAKSNRFYTILLKYIPMWALFYVPNAIVNANTRYKNVPEWLTSLLCSIANGLSMIIFISIQYSTLFSTGGLWMASAEGAMAGIMAFALAPCLIFAAFSARYIYKKTGNIWCSGLINAIVMCCITVFACNYTSDLLFPF